MEAYAREIPPDSEENTTVLHRFWIVYHSFFDRTVPHVIARWFFFVVFLMVYIVRVLKIEGFFVVTYALGIFLLSNFLAFLTPQIQPTTEKDPLLPTTDGEFRPFLRRLSEIKFWRGCTLAVIIGIVCTFFPFLDLPVFWPILLVYFITLLYITMRRQIAHMIRYKYIPFTYGKPRPQSKSPSGSLRSI